MTRRDADKPLSASELVDARRVILGHLDAQVHAAEQNLAKAETTVQRTHSERAKWNEGEPLTYEQCFVIGAAAAGIYSETAHAYLDGKIPSVEPVERLAVDLDLVRAYLLQQFGHDMYGGEQK